MYKNNEISYLDYNYNTLLTPRMLNAKAPLFQETFVIPTNTHLFDQSINEKVIQAREELADYINERADELIFTSVTKEAINTVITAINRIKELTQPNFNYA